MNAPIPDNDEERLRALHSLNLLDTAAEKEFDHLTMLAANIFGADSTLISLVDRDRQWFKSAVGLGICETDRESSFCGHTIAQGELMYIEDTQTDIRFAGNPLVLKYPFIRSYAGAPIFSSDGFAIGTICLLFAEVTHLSAVQLQHLVGFAQIVSDAVNSRMYRLKLQAEHDQQRQMISMVNHELRTPLASLQVMEAEQNLAAVEPLGYAICETTNHLALVIDDLAAIIRPDHKRSFETTDSVFSVIDRTCSSLNYLFRSSQIVLHIAADDEAWVNCEFNAQALRQIATNIIKNAIIHSGADDLWIKIVSSHRSEDQLGIVIEFSDNGKGVPKQYRDRIFETGFRQDTSVEGSGLGLRICTDLAETLNGTINYFESETGGAGFRLCMSLRTAQQENATSIAEEREQIAKKENLEGLRILVAEDNDLLQMLNEAMLTRYGVSFAGAEDGKVALELAKNEHFDVIITDIQMPEINGYELTEQLRALGYSGSVIGLSAHGQDGPEAQQMLELGADAIIGKPFTISKLVETLKSAA